MSFSGYDLATGRIPTSVGVQQGPAAVGVWVILAAAIAAIAFTYLVRPDRTAAKAVIGAAAAAGLLVLNAWQGFESLRNPFTRVDLELGLWASLIGIVGTFATAVVGLRDPGADVVEVAISLFARARSRLTNTAPPT